MGDREGHAPCAFCQGSDLGQEMIGETYSKGGVTVHEYCLYFASGLAQQGKETEGVMGFLVKDIQAEVKRSQKLRCWVCHKRGASIGCSKHTCSRTGHYPCLRTMSFLFQHFGNFQSFCPDHQPTQLPLPPTSSPMPSPLSCCICYARIAHVPSFSGIYCPSCRTSFHRKCLEKQARTAGWYFFRCAICNNKKDFLKEMLRLGIVVPKRDAQWELDGHFSDMYVIEKHCRADFCLCPHGRNYSAGRYRIKKCNTCGQFFGHSRCFQGSPQQCLDCVRHSPTKATPDGQGTEVEGAGSLIRADATAPPHPTSSGEGTPVGYCCDTPPRSVSPAPIPRLSFAGARSLAPPDPVTPPPLSLPQKRSITDYNCTPSPDTVTPPPDSLLPFADGRSVPSPESSAPAHLTAQPEERLLNDCSYTVACNPNKSIRATVKDVQSPVMISVPRRQQTPDTSLSTPLVRHSNLPVEHGTAAQPHPVPVTSLAPGKRMSLVLQRVALPIRYQGHGTASLTPSESASVSTPPSVRHSSGSDSPSNDGYIVSIRLKSSRPLRVKRPLRTSPRPLLMRGQEFTPSPLRCPQRNLLRCLDPPQNHHSPHLENSSAVISSKHSTVISISGVREPQATLAPPPATLPRGTVLAPPPVTPLHGTVLAPPPVTPPRGTALAPPPVTPPRGTALAPPPVTPLDGTAQICLDSGLVAMAGVN